MANIPQTLQSLNKKQKGIGLLEVVVAMLIIGLGMAMSIAMIQSGVKNSISALNQNTARTLLESMSDRMRINRYAADAYRFGDPDNNIANNSGNIDLLSGISWDDGWDRPTEAKLKSDNPRTACTYCTPAQITARDEAFKQGYKDVQNWTRNVEESLPGARAAILELPNNQYRIVLQWRNIPSNLQSLESGSTDIKDIPTQEASLVFTL